MDIKTFLSAFYSENDEACIRVFSDRRAEDPEYKGNKYTEKLKNIDVLLPTLKQHNEKHRGIFFVVNCGGHTDEEITRINAQFVEMDTGSFEEQQEKINAFALPPSIVVKTRKSLHCYWLMKDSEVSKFREIQLRLVKQFTGDSMCQNESRCMRIPGFYHSKQEPVLVECIKFEPQIKYTQSELQALLPQVQIPEYDAESRTEFNGEVGSGQRLMDKCEFCRYCKENAARLSEPEWYAFVTNMSLTRDGAELVHEISKPYPRYSKAETDDKIRHAINEHKPHTCLYIQERLGFKKCKDCSVKAPVAYAVLSMAERVEQLSDSDISEDMIFDNKTIELMAYAKKNAPAVYGKFKQKIKGKCSIKDFEAAVNFKNKSYTVVEDTAMPLNLDGIALNGAVQPANWNVTMEHGIQKIVYSKDGNTVVTVCPSPMVIHKRFGNIDTGSEKVCIAFYRDNKWKKIIAPRSQIFNRTSIIKYADYGLPLSSETANDVISYLCAYEEKNIKAIPLVESISRIGWIGKKFYPYDAKSDIYFDTDYNEAMDIVKALEPQGNYELWKKTIAKVRENVFARFLIAASFASVLLLPLKHRVFFIHIWHDSKSGKTAAIKAGISVWGNPLQLMGSFNATSVGLERKAGTLNHLPFAIDELQVLNEKRLSSETIIYGLSNGFGRLRGTKDGGVQEMVTWRNIIITSGEQALSKENSNDGVLTRVFELYGKPVENADIAHELHILSENNYGYAGKEYMKYITAMADTEIMSDYGKMCVKLAEQYGKSAYVDNVSVVCLGDYYSSMAVVKIDRETAWNEALELGIQILSNNEQLIKTDTVSRAWDFVIGWITSNYSRFSTDSNPCYGTIENDKCYVIPSCLRNALEDNNFDYGKITRGFKERGLIETFGDNSSRMQTTKRINGVPAKVFVIKLPEDNISVRPLI